MARFNKTAHLRQNIDAIKAAFTLDRENRKLTPEEKQLLQAYSGFGAIKEVIDPLPASDNKVKGTPLTSLIRELHTVLKENTPNEREYKRYLGGIKDSILSAFYTPPVIVDALVSSLQQSGITPFRAIDPSAGAGAFADSLRKSAPDAEITCFEKDPATGLILEYLHPEENVRVQSYETIEPKYAGYFDVAASNIPFGDVAIFDPAFSTNTDPVRRQATRTLHNYFFMKSVETVRDGGIIAFITSQGVLNSEQNRPIREWLAGRCDVVSSIRLPNNLFTDHAGTEVGSDLIVLQKRPSGEYPVTQRQADFIESRKLSNGISINNLFQQLDRVIQTDAKVGTDPYGKPAMEFTHSGGETGIAGDLRRMLVEDFSKHLDLERYIFFAPEHAEQTQVRNVAAPQVKAERTPQVDIAAGSNTVEAEVTTSRQQRPPEEKLPDDLNPLWQTDDLDPFWQAVEEHFENLDRQDNAQTVIPAEEQAIEPAGQFSQEEQEAIAKAWAEGYDLDITTGELTPTAEDLAEFGAWADEQERRLYEEYPPTPEDFGITEPILENPVQATTEPRQNVQTYPAGNFSGTLFDMDDPEIFSKPTAEAAPQINVQQEPLITLYDLFGFSEEERSQVSRPRRRKKTAKPEKSKQEEERFIDWREEMILNAHREREEKERQAGQSASGDIRPVYPVEDARKTEQQEALRLEQERIEQEEYLKPIPFKAEILPHYREGSLVSDKHNRIGYLRDMNGLQPMFHPLELTETQEAKASIYVEIRDTYYHLYQNEAERLEANPALREMLNRLYDNFTDRFGKLNEKKNLDLIKMDARGTEILSLERYIDGVTQKADIFHHPVAFNPNEITEAADAREALVASLNRYAAVNLEYMAGLTGGTRDNILEELHGSIYFNPEINGYEIADKYIAGNVIEKADRVERFLRDNPNHTPAADSLRALREATPKPVAFDDLDFNFGERWIPKGIYEKYASHLFDTDVSINLASNIDEYSVKADRLNVKILNQYAVDSQNRKFNGVHLMKHALQNTSPDITKKVNKLIDGKMQEVKVRDPEAIQLANSKIDEMRGGFSNWLRDQSPEFKDRLADLYNRTFNCFVRPNYDGSHQTFPGLDLKGLGIKDLYKSQKDAIWMDKLLGGNICDHEVGGGKTLIMCCGAMEKKRLGLANKPMITGLKANIHEIAKTFCTAYPNARVLYPGKEDFTPKNREKIFREIKNNDWDAVILTHEQFAKIPQSPELQREILQTELDSVEENLEVLKAQGKEVSRAMLKGCIRRKLNLEAKLQTVMHTIENRKDDTVDFKHMGIDHLYVDESHKFKNLTFNTRHDRVAGLGNPEGSGRALNMLFAIRTIQERTGRDLGATFLLGTTISNSLTELYLLFKYLRPQEMERQNLKTFDAWVAVFAKKSIDYEFSVTNEIVQKERFRYFIKVPELAAFYSEITDFRTAADIGIDRRRRTRYCTTSRPRPTRRHL
jgi:N12 class adenine-specific DNA methylase